MALSKISFLIALVGATSVAHASSEQLPNGGGQSSTYTNIGKLNKHTTETATPLTVVTSPAVEPLAVVAAPAVIATSESPVKTCAEEVVGMIDNAEVFLQGIVLQGMERVEEDVKSMECAEHEIKATTVKK